ncbi:MAG: VWA-like domain-containing protein [Lachnospiraceae bacterium]
MADANDAKIEKLAADVLRLARDTIMVQLRFLDAAMGRLALVSKPGIACVMTDGTNIYYDSVYLLKAYQKEPAAVPRMYLHMLLHCIFHHQFGYGRLEQELWDLAVDVAVEETILGMELPGFSLSRDEEAKQLLGRLKLQVPVLTAEKLYRYFRVNSPSSDYQKNLIRLFKVDRHESWKQREVLEMSQADWKKISERVKADLKSFSNGKTGEENLEKNLTEATRDRYDYGALLQKFVVMGEDITPSEDEFDYIYYTYGLSRYGNMPLIEPLEYKETKKIKEFVIALDTSASCRGPIVKGFLNKTYSLLKSAENFFTKINVHIVQCDNEVRSDTKITCDEDFNAFLVEGKLTGFGSTDFRPVFSYVDDLIKNGEFDNLKGLIYFTDGFGVYPEKMPDYDVVFAFLNEDEGRPPLPVWAIKAIIEEEELEKEAL